VAAARKAALDACAKAGGECRIVELIEGDWTINTACQVQQRFFKSEPAVKAFAVSRSGHCASAVGKRDAETARTEALTECERIAGNCRVIEIDLGNWQLGEACTKRLEEWRKKPTARAFAVSRHGACGWSDSESSQSDARRTALAECANRGADCKVIEVSEGNWEIETDCKETYDKWTRLRGRGSFAVGRNGGCGYTYGYGSTSEADSEALRHCRESDGVECKVIGRR
jgi:ABC-type sugar transport system substrate-binding protein